jgi:hypothetical protein
MVLLVHASMSACRRLVSRGATPLRLPGPARRGTLGSVFNAARYESLNGRGSSSSSSN